MEALEAGDEAVRACVCVCIPRLQCLLLVHFTRHGETDPYAPFSPFPFLSLPCLPPCPVLSAARQAVEALQQQMAAVVQQGFGGPLGGLLPGAPGMPPVGAPPGGGALVVGGGAGGGGAAGRAAAGPKLQWHMVGVDPAYRHVDGRALDTPGGPMQGGWRAYQPLPLLTRCPLQVPPAPPPSLSPLAPRSLS